MSVLGLVVVLLLLFGLVFLVLAAYDVNTARWRFGWAGLACWLLAEILQRLSGINIH